MTREEAVNWIISLSADIGKIEHRDLWHYEQALSEIKDMLESERKTGKWMIIDPQRQEDIDNDNYMYTCSRCLHNDLHARSQVCPLLLVLRSRDGGGK